MTSIQAFTQRHPVLSYYVLTFVLSWGGCLVVVGPGGFLGTTAPTDALAPILYLAILVVLTLIGPSVAGLLMTGLVHGRAGYRALLARLLKWRVGARWYAVALLTAPLSIVAVLAALSLTSPLFLPGIVTVENKVSLLLSGLIAGLLIGSLEELGWTGFAIPEVRRRYGVLATGLIVGVLWGVWHYPLFSASGSSSGAIMHAFTVGVLLFSFLPPFRVLMVWVYERTGGSLLVAMLMHASLTASMLILQSQAAEVTAVSFDLVWAAVLWAFVAVVAVANGRQLPRPGQPPASGGAPQLTPR